MLDAMGGDLGTQQELFREVERVSREMGFGQVFDDWGPDVAWLSFG